MNIDDQLRADFIRDPKAPAGPALVHASPFHIGPLLIEPSLRRVTRPDGASTSIEPLMMHVLMTLADAGGATVSREDLIERCWRQRIVGDDSVARVILRLRKLAAGFAGGAFEIETIPKVGYRLARSIPKESASVSSNRRLGWPRRRIIAGAALVILAPLAATAVRSWQVSRVPPPRAMELYRRGLQFRGQASLQQTEQSVAFFREALQIDPTFADAWGALAWGYRGMLAYGPRPDAAEIANRCRSAAARALELDPDNVEAQAAILLLTSFYRRWLDVERGCRNLMLQHPGNSLIEFNLGLVLLDLGRLREALPFFSAVTEREPFWPLARYQLALSLLTLNRFDEAEATLDRAIERWPRLAPLWCLKHRVLFTAAGAERAQAFAADLVKMPIGSDEQVELEIASVDVIGAPAQRINEMKARILSFVERRPGMLVFGVGCLVAMQAMDEAFDLLNGYFFGEGPMGALQSFDPQTRSITSCPTSTPLFGDPRFSRLLERTGLVRAWQTSGRPPDFFRAN